MADELPASLEAVADAMEHAGDGEGDQETWHMVADDLLRHALVLAAAKLDQPDRVAIDRLIEAWDHIDKWYA